MDDPTRMTICELMKAMARICLPEGNKGLSVSDRATMYISLMLEASRRDLEGFAADAQEGNPKALDSAGKYNRWIAWLTQQPAAPPVPDWSQAPSWANYWAVDRTGSSFWHEREPVPLAGQGWLSDGRRTLDSFPAEGWATTLQHRPQGQE